MCGGILFMMFILFAILPLVLYALFWYFSALFVIGFIYGFFKGGYLVFKFLCQKTETVKDTPTDDFTKILLDNGYKA